MNRGDHVTAVQLAQKAKDTGVTFGSNEDSPESIFQAHASIRDRMQQRRNPKETISHTS